jgi:hypothetical protein
MDVLAYRKAHPFATDEEIAVALKMTRERVVMCRRKAGIPAGRTYIRADEVVEAIRGAGEMTLRELTEWLGMTTGAAEMQLREQRRRGVLVSVAGRPMRWRVA